MDEQERAERAAAAMRAGDRASQALGLELARIRPGRAVFTMKVRPDMVNGHGICHGGLIYLLADTAFAFAANSRNRNTLAQINTITYLSPGKVGEVLTAEAAEAGVAGRTSIFDVVVTGADGRQVALFRGHGRQVRGQVFDENG